MTLTVEFVPELPDRDAYHALLVEYFGTVMPMLEALGGPSLLASEVAAEKMADLESSFPPHGRTVLAHQDGRLVGCGSLIDIGAGRGEMKRLYVRPEAQGQGLGWKLLDMRIAEARAMGLTRLVVDTVRGNTSMLNMYEKRGFNYIDRYEDNANPESFAPFLVFLEKHL